MDKCSRCGVLVTFAYRGLCLRCSCTPIGEPSPAEIEAECKAIQERWSATEEANRRGVRVEDDGTRPHWSPPVTSIEPTTGEAR